MYPMNQKTRRLGLLVALLLAVVLVSVTQLNAASAEKINENYAHNPITALYGPYKQICGLHVCVPSEIPKNP